MILCPNCSAENIEGADLCVQCGQPLGNLSLREPESLIEKSLIRDRMEVLQPRTPIVVAHDQTVGSVLKLMLERKIGCVFVSDSDAIVGVFTERDALLRLNVDAAEHAEKPISEFMTADPKSLTAKAKLAFAVRMMDQGGYRHVLIVDEDNQPTGVTSVRDILGYLSERMTA